MTDYDSSNEYEPIVYLNNLDSEDEDVSPLTTPKADEHLFEELEILTQDKACKMDNKISPKMTEQLFLKGSNRSNSCSHGTRNKNTCVRTNTSANIQNLTSDKHEHLEFPSLVRDCLPQNKDTRNNIQELKGLDNKNGANHTSYVEKSHEASYTSKDKQTRSEYAEACCTEELTETYLEISDEENESNQNLSCFFKDLLEKKIDFQLSTEETTDIISAVQYLVQAVVTKISSTVEWLPVSRIVSVGSMAEKTSIIKPDEFDFLVILQQNGVEVECTEHRKGYVHLKVTDRSSLKLWRKWCRDGYLKGSVSTGLREKLKTVLETVKMGAVSQLLESKDKYFDSLGDAFLVEVVSVINEASQSDLTDERETGTLRIDREVRKHGPAFMPCFTWKSKKSSKIVKITVDLTPAIEVDIPSNFVTKDDTCHENFLIALENHGKMLLISDHEDNACPSGLCFRVTFTETEIALVKSLSKHHVDVYKLLKYIFNSGDGYTFIPSYAFKTLVLIHACYCNEEELGPGGLACCCKCIISDFLHYVFLSQCERQEKFQISRIIRIFLPGKKMWMFIPSVFMQQHNILDTKDYPLTCEYFMSAVERMLESLFLIGQKKKPRFEELKVVNSLITVADGLELFPFTLKRGAISFLEQQELFHFCYQYMAAYCGGCEIHQFTDENDQEESI